MPRDTNVNWSADETELVMSGYIAAPPGTLDLIDYPKRIESAMGALTEKRRRYKGWALRQWTLKQLALRGAKLDVEPKKEKQGKSSRLHWREEEKVQLLDVARSRGHLEYGEATSRLEWAMSAMPKDRRRPICRSLVQWFRAEMKKPFPAPKLATPEPEPTTPLPEQLRAKNYEPSLAYDVQAPHTLGEQLAESVGTFIGESIAKALQYQPLKDAISALVAVALNKPEPASPATSGESFDVIPNPLRKPRVLIAGLENHLCEEITKAIGDKFILKFWIQNTSITALRRATSEADITIGVTKFISHAADAIMQSNSPNYIRHAGGVKNLKIRLGDLAQVVNQTHH